MSFKDLKLKNCYDSDEDDILNNFYIPVLQNSIKYFRLAGFFSSTSLSIAARGLQGLLTNNGEMKLIAGVVFSKRDIEAIENGIENPEDIISDFITEEIDNIENDFIRDHILGLSWLVAKNKLKIKLAILQSPSNYSNQAALGIFHQKIGIFEDMDGDSICFSGSVNESETAWKYNIEDFNVFRSWIPEEKKYLDSLRLRFEKYWIGNTKRSKIIDVPEAIKQKFIKIAPKNFTELNFDRSKKEKQINTHLHESGENLECSKKSIVLREYQKKAISKWIENEGKGIFEMATGTGKTFTALGCVDHIIKQNKKTVIIISSPYQHLVSQWKKEIFNFGLEIDSVIADSSNKNWKKEVSNKLIDIFLDYKDNVAILTTHTTLCSDDFIRIIKNNSQLTYLLVGDEVHGIGSKVRKNGLLEIYKYRLGLSATPKRWFDEQGTDFLFKYFGDVVFEFDLWNAINTINPSTGKTFLVPYKYLANYISLNGEEINEYIQLCNSISKLYKRMKFEDDYNSQELMERLIFKRADLIKNAENKYNIFEKLIDEIGEEIDHTLIYCSPQQIQKLKEILMKKGIISHSFTMKEGTKPDAKFGGISERDYILQKFEEGEYQTLVAMKCLDEGVNIPPARRAILMASSGNPKEYIQRIGRILRRYPNKDLAVIYDIVVVPSLGKIPLDMREIETKIFNKELARYEEIAKNALNNADALDEVYKLKS